MKMFDIDHYFEEFVECEKIFHDRDVLRPEFIPHKLPNRNLQIRKIAETVACSLKHSMPSNLFIFGKTGTGKTAVVKHVSEHLNTQCRKSGIPETTWIFLNCQEVNTAYRILAKICNTIDSENPIPIAGWPLDVVFDALLTKLDKFVDGICFLVLDEIDILVKNIKINHDILYNLARINAHLTKARVNLIGISNVLTFKNALDPRVLSSLAEEEIVFPAYNAGELKDILDQRAEMAFQPGALSSGVIPLCGALAAKDHGDARKALDLLRRAGELAERRKSPMVTEDYVYLAQDNIERDKMQEYCEKLPLQQKIVLLGIALMEKIRKKEMITGEVYNCYLELQKQIPGVSKLTQRRVSELIRELDLAGLVNARVRSSGRYGRTKVIKLNISQKEAAKYLESDTRLADLIDYQPKCAIEMKNIHYKGKPYRRLA